MHVPVSVWVTKLSSCNPEINPVLLASNPHNLDEVSLNLPSGAYTSLRTYQGHKALCLKDHFSRLEQTALLAGNPFHLEEARLRIVLRSVISQAFRLLRDETLGQQDIADLRLRLTLDLEAQPGDLYIAVEPLVTPLPAAYRKGVAIVTCSLQRILPKAKLTRFITRSYSIRQSLPSGVNEAVMTDSRGYLLEGLTSNFFAVFRGELHTAGERVLAGITRALVIECAKNLGIPLSLHPVNVSDLNSAEEAFITSSSRGVLPVCRVDELKLGAGKPGSLTQRLRAAYAQRILELIELI